MIPTYDIEVYPSQLTHESYDRLRALLGPDLERFPTWEAIKAEATKGKDRTLVVAENVSRDIMAQLETSLDKPGIHVAAVQRRHYPYGTAAAHAIGYLNEVSADELKTRKEEGYQSGDTVGRTGLERQWEPYLRGHKGFEKVVVNRRGLRRTDVRIADLVTDGPISQSPMPGNNVILTLDLDVQKIVERALRGVHSAAAVVIDIEDRTHPRHCLEAGLRSQHDVGRWLGRKPRPRAERSSAPAARQGPFRHLQPGFDLQADHGTGGLGGDDHRARGQGEVRRPHPGRPPAFPLHQGAQDREPVRRHRAKLQRLLLRLGRPARDDEPHGQDRGRLGARRPHRSRPQRRAGRLHPDRGMAPGARRRRQEGRWLRHRARAQHRHRRRRDARHGLADGALVRDHRVRRQAVAAPNCRAGRIPDRPGPRGFPAAGTSGSDGLAGCAGLSAPCPLRRGLR